MLNRLLKKGQSGFTIIEVMIVLAIAGLIMVVVLVAIPAIAEKPKKRS
jgi:prepilin-type N-terminal cleavage/methylation domain-containing protein